LSERKLVSVASRNSITYSFFYNCFKSLLLVWRKLCRNYQASENHFALKFKKIDLFFCENDRLIMIISYKVYHLSQIGNGMIRVLHSPLKIIIVLGVILVPISMGSMGKTYGLVPNYIKSTTFQTGGGAESTNLCSIEYFDGMGRRIQKQLKLNGQQKKLVSGTYYDAMGRPEVQVKEFPVGADQLGFIADTAYRELRDSANSFYDGLSLSSSGDIFPDAEGYAFDSIEYYLDPLNRERGFGKAGKDFSLAEGNAIRKWYFGVPKSTSFLILTIPGGGTVTIRNGFIGDLANSSFDAAVLDSLAKMDSIAPDSDYFLEVTSGPNPGVFTQVLTDVFGNKVAHWTCDGNGQIIIAETQYDLLGNVLREIPPVNSTAPVNPNTYTYNKRGKILTAFTPDGGEKKFTYDDAGRVSTMTDANNNVIEYHYDRLGREVLKRRRGNSLPLSQTMYDDISDLLTMAKGLGIDKNILYSLDNLRGRVVCEISYSGIRNKVIDLYSYDEKGNIRYKYKFIPSMPMQKFSYSYDLMNRLVADTLFSGYATTIKKYVYNAQGLLEKIQRLTSGVTVDLVQYIYNERGQLVQKIFGDGNIYRVGYDYNIQDWTTLIGSHYFEEKIGYNEPNLFGQSNHSRQFNGNISAAQFISRSPSDSQHVTNIYTYDNVNRLTGVESTDSAYSAAYRYNELGRFTYKQENTVHPDYQYYFRSNRLKNTTGGPEKNYVYDKNGNMVLDKSKNMAVLYDWRNLPIAFYIYTDLPDSGLEINSDGEWEAPEGTVHPFHQYLGYLPGVEIVSRVIMMYDAQGNRVLKVAVK